MYFSAKNMNKKEDHRVIVKFSSLTGKVLMDKKTQKAGTTFPQMEAVIIRRSLWLIDGIYCAEFKYWVMHHETKWIMLRRFPYLSRRFQQTYLKFFLQPNDILKIKSETFNISKNRSTCLFHIQKVTFFLSNSGKQFMNCV